MPRNPRTDFPGSGRVRVGEPVPLYNLSWPATTMGQWVTLSVITGITELRKVEDRQVCSQLQKIWGNLEMM